MIHGERKEVVKRSFDWVPISAECDICQKPLVPTELAKDEEHSDLYNYFLITTHHYDWSNDSCESYEYYVACCPECAMKHFQKYWADNFEQYSTKKWEIERHDKLVKLGCI